VNELIASHEPANNSVINAEEKTEHELTILSKKYAELIELVKENKEEKSQYLKQCLKWYGHNTLK